jgi:hypothetical protein
MAISPRQFGSQGLAMQERPDRFKRKSSGVAEPEPRRVRFRAAIVEKVI